MSSANFSGYQFSDNKIKRDYKILITFHDNLIKSEYSNENCYINSEA